jgi:hypothetical protein
MRNVINEATSSSEDSDTNILGPAQKLRCKDSKLRKIYTNKVDKMLSGYVN